MSGIDFIPYGLSLYSMKAILIFSLFVICVGYIIGGCAHMKKSTAETKDRYIKVFEGKDKLWYSRIVGGNNEIIWSSEGHVTKQSALKTARSLYLDLVEVPPRHRYTLITETQK